MTSVINLRIAPELYIDVNIQTVQVRLLQYPEQVRFYLSYYNRAGTVCICHIFWLKEFLTFQTNRNVKITNTKVKHTTF